MSTVIRVREKLKQLQALEQQSAAQPVAVDALALFKNAWKGAPDDWQGDILQSTSNRLLMLCSRQSGKSVTTSTAAVATALAKPHALVLILSPTLRQSGLLFKKCLRVYDSTPGLPALTERKQLSLEMANGSSIVSLPGKPDNVRGFSAPDLVIIDEAAFAPDALYHAVTPMLAVSNGKLMLLSSPMGKRGFFYNEYLIATGQKQIEDDEEYEESEPDYDWHYVEVPATRVPRMRPRFLKSERTRLGPLFEQEYMCQFLDSETALFSYQEIQTALDNGAEIERWF